MAYLLGQPGSGLGFGQRELVGWPARMHGLGEPQMSAGVIGGFAFDKADLGPPQYTKIIALARQIVAGAIRAVRLIGHTDPVGTPAYNKDLGQRRADVVADALRKTLNRMRPGSAASVMIAAETAGETQPIDRGPSEPARARNRRVEVFLPGTPPPVPQPTPSPATKTTTVKVVVRSSILPITALGSVPCTVTLAPVPIPGLPPLLPVPSSTALRAFAAHLGLVIRDHIRSDAKDKMYRLFTEQRFQVVCQNGQILSVTPAPMDTDVGLECIIPSHGCLTPAPIITSGLTLRRKAPDTFEFGWMGEGCPHPLAEPAFQAICRRTSRFIWHSVTGTIQCGPAGLSTTVALSGSLFPTHAVFINGVLRASRAQGALGMLWDPQPGNPNRVR